MVCGPTSRMANKTSIIISHGKCSSRVNWWLYFILSSPEGSSFTGFILWFPHLLSGKLSRLHIFSQMYAYCMFSEVFFFLFVCLFSKSNLTLRAVTCHLPCRRLSSQSCTFSSSHVWMWELDHKEGWAPKNWCFWIVVFEKCWGPLMDENLVARELMIRK